MFNVKDIYLNKKVARSQFIAALDSKSFDFQIATWFGTGLIIPAPGTWGTIGGIALGIPLILVTNWIFTLFIALILFFVGLKSIAVMGIEKTENTSFLLGFLPSFDKTDSTSFFLSFLPAFILFRIFNIWKPFPIGILNKKVKGAWGTMIDDTAACILTYAAYWIAFMMLYLIFAPRIC